MHSGGVDKLWRQKEKKCKKNEVKSCNPFRQNEGISVLNPQNKL